MTKRKVRRAVAQKITRKIKYFEDLIKIPFT